MLPYHRNPSFNRFHVEEYYTKVFFHTFFLSGNAQASIVLYLAGTVLDKSSKSASAKSFATFLTNFIKS